MYFSTALVNVLFLVSFSCSTFAIAPSTLKPVAAVGKVGASSAKNTTLKTTTIQKGTSLKPGQIVSKGNRTGVVAGSSGNITTRFGGEGTVEEECQCTLSYLCNPENRAPGYDCSDSAFICCKIPYASVSIPNSPSSYVESPSAQPTDTESSADDCTCVIREECLDPNAREGGSGLITPKFECKSPDVCCPNDKISKTKENGGNPVSPPWNPPPPPEATIHFPPDPTPSTAAQECVCVTVDDCLDKEFISGGGFGIDPKFGKECTQPHVCCPSDKVSKTVVVIPPTGYTPSPPVIIEHSTIPQPPTPFPQPVDPTVCNPEYCGKRQGIEKRITAPEDWAKTDFGEFPWMVLILKMEFAKDGTFSDKELLCGASLMSASVVLTAAHCVYRVEKSIMKIRAGEYDTREGASELKPHQDRFVERISIHDKYDRRVLYNDLALIKVSENFVLDSHIYPICMPQRGSWYAANTIYDPKVCVAIGWGKNDFHNGHYQNTLKKVDLSLVPRDECQLKLQQTKLTKEFKLHSSFICASGLPGHDTCKGDGGGPLFCALYNDPSRYVQVGITSWGLECGLPLPSVYASLEANIEWLTNEFNSMSVFRRSGFGAQG